MTIIFFAVIYLVLLLLIRESMYKLHALISIIFFFVLLQWIFFRQLLPFFKTLHTLIASLPYGNALLFTAGILLLSHHITEVFDEHEYEAIAGLLKVSVRLTLLVFWVAQLTPVFQQLATLLERLQ